MFKKIVFRRLAMIEMGGLQTKMLDLESYEKEFGDINMRLENSYSDYQYDKIHSFDMGSKKPWSAAYAIIDKAWLK